MASPLGKKIKDNLQALADAKVHVVNGVNKTGAELGAQVEQPYTNAFGDAIEQFLAGTLLDPAPALVWDSPAYVSDTWEPTAGQLRPQITLSWLTFNPANSPYSGGTPWSGTAQKIRVKRKTHGGSETSSTLVELTPSSTSYVDQDLSFNVSYDYILEVIDLYGTVGLASSTQVIATQTYPTPSDPLDPIVTAPGSDQIALVFLGETDPTKKSQVDRYVVQQRKAPATPDGRGGYTVPVAPSWGAWETINETKALALTMSGLTNTYVFQFRYQIVNVYGLSSAWNTAVTANLKQPVLPEANVTTSEASRSYFVEVAGKFFARQATSPKNIQVHFSPSYVDPARISTAWTSAQDGWLWYQTDLGLIMEFEGTGLGWQTSPGRPLTSTIADTLTTDGAMSPAEKTILFSGDNASHAGYKGLVAEKILLGGYGTKFNSRLETDPAYQAYVSQFLTVERVLLNPLKGLLSNLGATSTGVTSELVQELSKLEAIRKDLGRSFFLASNTGLSTTLFDRSRLPWSSADTINGVSFYDYVSGLASSITIFSGTASPTADKTGDLWIHTGTLAVNRWSGSAWSAVTVSTSFLMFTGVPASSRKLLSASNSGALPAVYTPGDALVVNADLTSVTPYSKVVFQSEIHFALKNRTGGFLGHDWAPASYLYDDPTGLRKIRLFDSTTVTTYATRDVLVPGADSSVTSPYNGDSILFQSGKFYFSENNSSGSFNPTEWGIPQSVGDTSTPETVEKIVSQFTSQDVASLLEKNSLAMQWSSIKSQQIGLVSRASAYSISTALLVSAYTALERLFDGTDGILVDLKSVSIRPGLWDNIRALVQAWNTEARDIQTLIDSVITDITSPTIPTSCFTNNGTNPLLADGSIRLVFPLGLTDNVGGSGIKGVKIYRCLQLAGVPDYTSKICIGSSAYVTASNPTAPTYFDDKTAEPNIPYYFGISAYDRNQNESAISWYNVLGTITAVTANDTRAPSTVGTVTADATHGQVTVSWPKLSYSTTLVSADYYITGYEVEVTQDITQGSPTWTRIALTPNTSVVYGNVLSVAQVANWRFRVRAVTRFEAVGAWSTMGSAPTTTNLVPPPVVTFTAKTEGGFIRLDWVQPTSGPVPNETMTYVLEKSIDSGTGWTTWTPALSVNGLTYLDQSASLTSLSDFASWRYRIKAQYSFGAVSTNWLALAVAPTSVGFLPNDPTTVSGGTDLDGTIRVTWGAGAGTGGRTVKYVVEKATNLTNFVAFGETVDTFITDPAFPSTDTSLALYRYRVTAYTAWNTFSTSIVQAISTTDFIPSSPTSLTADAIYTGEVKVSWNAGGPRTQGYRLYRSMVGAGGPFTLIASVTEGLTYLDIPSNIVSSPISAEIENLVYQVIPFTSYGLSPPSVFQQPALATYSSFFTADPVAPTVNVNDHGGLKVTWPGLGGITPVSFYRVEKSTDGTNFSTFKDNLQGVSIDDDTIIYTATPSVNLKYRIRAVTSYGAVSRTPNTTSQPAFDLSYLFPPTVASLAGTTQLDGKVRMTWAPGAGSTKTYLVEKNINGAGWNQIAEVSETTWIEPTVETSVTNLNNLLFRIKGKSSWGSVSQTYSTSVVPSDVDFVPPIPTIASPTSYTDEDGRLSLYWTHPGGRTQNFILEKSTDSGSTYPVTIAVDDITWTDPAIPANLTALQALRYRVSSQVIYAGGVAIKSATFGVTVVTTSWIADAVADASVKVKAREGRVSIQWDRPSKKSVRFVIEKSSGGLGAWTPMNITKPDGTTASSVEVSDLYYEEPIGTVESSTITTWCYRILAKTSFGAEASAYGTQQALVDVTGYGTYTPATITTLKTLETGRTISLSWDKQTTLMGFLRYELQVSKDDSTWYSLQTDGTDWKGTLNAFTSSQSFFSHTRVPMDVSDGTSLYKSDGTIGAGGVVYPAGSSVPTRYYYRVRTITTTTSYTSGQGWSSSVIGVARPYDALDLSVENLKVGSRATLVDIVGGRIYTAQSTDAGLSTYERVDSVINPSLGTVITPGTNTALTWIDLDQGRLRLGGATAYLHYDGNTFRFVSTQLNLSSADLITNDGVGWLKHGSRALSWGKDATFTGGALSEITSSPDQKKLILQKNSSLVNSLVMVGAEQGFGSKLIVSDDVTNMTNVAMALSSGIIETVVGPYRRFWSSVANTLTWDRQINSQSGIVGACRIKVRFPNFSAGQANLMIGLNTDPSTDAHYASIDFALYMSAAGLEIWENGVSRGSYGSITATDDFEIRYDGKDVRYYKNGGHIFTSESTVPVGAVLFIDASYYTVASTNVASATTANCAFDLIAFEPLYSAPLAVPSPYWKKQEWQTPGQAWRTILGGDANANGLVTNVFWSGSAWLREDATKVGLAYLHHMANGRHEWRGAVSGGSSSASGLSLHMALSANGGLSIAHSTNDYGKLNVAIPGDPASAPSPGASTNLQLVLSNSTGSGYGLLAGVLSSGKGYLTAQRMDGSGTVYDILINPSGGNVGVGALSTEKLHVTGNVRVDDYSGNAGFKLSFDVNSKTLNFIYVGA